VLLAGCSTSKDAVEAEEAEVLATPPPPPEQDEWLAADSGVAEPLDLSEAIPPPVNVWATLPVAHLRPPRLPGPNQLPPSQEPGTRPRI